MARRPRAVVDQNLRHEEGARMSESREEKSPAPETSVPTGEETQRAHVRISGHVQGVYYRSAATEQARVLGLRGVVRNLPSGEVELVAEGPLPVLQQLIAWCHLGPPAARIDEVVVSFTAATQEFADFRVLRQPQTAPRSAADSSD